MFMPVPASRIFRPWPKKARSAVFSPSQLTQLLIAFGLLGAFPLIIKKIMNRFRTTPNPDANEFA